MERVIVITANVGNFDTVHKLPEQTVSFDYACVNNVNLEGYSDRMKGKFPKCQGHKFFNNPILIWIDGSVEITSNTFVADMIEKLNHNMVVSPKHPHRNNCYDELDFVIRQMESGDEYLLKRYDLEKIKGELKFISDNEMPKEYPLRNAGICARWNNIKINSAFDEWWKLIQIYSEFDQVLFNYICWKHELKINEIDWSWFKVHR